MSHRMKFHLIAILLIVVIVSIVHTLTQPKALPPRIVAVAQYTPTILEATWGRNCNPQIADAMLQEPQRYEARPAVPDPSAPQQKPLAQVQHNNVLDAVKKLCDGQETCVIEANTETLGQILPTCQSKLEVQFYCKETERVRKRSVNQGQSLTLDCSNKAY